MNKPTTSLGAIPMALLVAPAGGLLLISAAIAIYDTTSTRQIGFNGVGMQVTDSDERIAERIAENALPVALPPAAASGALAVDTYENVHVLGHLTTGEFTRLMTAMTLWVAPEQGCAYCHNTQNLASDELYPKVVARRMLQMTMYVNENWQDHVQGTGVTCYTCHRGNPVPSNLWYHSVPDDSFVAGYRGPQNGPGSMVGLTSLPNDALEVFLDGDSTANIRVQSPGEALPSGNRSSIKQTEWTYGLMMHFSSALGVNCTYCHNSREWSDWSQSPATRARAWHGIRMVRDLNQAYIEPLSSVLPAERLGPQGDAPSLSCGTCHQGAYRPLMGQSMLGDYAALARAVPQPERTVVPTDAMPTDAAVEPTDDAAVDPTDAGTDGEPTEEPGAEDPTATPEPPTEEPALEADPAAEEP